MKLKWPNIARKTICPFILFALLYHPMSAQFQLDVEGNARIQSMDTVTFDFANVVRLADGTIATQNYKVGDFTEGGIVFFVDATGVHGLVCATSDESPMLGWNSGTNVRTRALGDGVYAGEMNTTLIIAVQAVSSDNGSDYAAYICSIKEVIGNGITYGDWYLPSFFELDLICQNKAIISAASVAHGGTGLQDEAYWSSTEDEESPPFNAIRKDFDRCSQGSSPKSSLYWVRAVRRF
jgi:hypothetical protein